jgi:nucleoside 2-deoxyribosyltransferase
MYAWFMLFLFIIFLDRRYEFNKRALTIPFSMAVDSLRNEAPKENKNMVIYLAGGFTSNWQSDVIKLNPSLSFLDPRNHQLSETLQYTNWDLQAIRKSDLIFAYLEKNNPGGYALALEIGYAKALGKHIIFVDEKSKSNDEISKYLAMIHACADVTFNTLNEGILYLAKLKEISV